MSEILDGGFPTDWKHLSLGTIADIQSSNVDKKSIPGELPVVLCNYMDVYSNHYIHDQIAFMKATATRIEIDKFQLRPGDVLITKDSETPDDIAIPAVVDSQISNRTLCGYHLAQIRPHQDLISGRFLGYSLLISDVNDQFRKTANGTTRYGLTIGSISNAQIPLPPLPEQRRIAEILDTVDEAIRQTEQVIAKLQQMKQGLLHDLLTRGIDDNGELRDPERHPEQFKDSALGRIPKAWDVGQLGSSVSKSEYGISSSLSNTGVVPVLRMNNFSNGEADLSDLKYSSVAEARKLSLEYGDVLFNRTNSIDHVGRSGIWRCQLPIASFASYLVRLVPDRDKLSSEFLNTWLNWPLIQGGIRRWATPGVHQVNINPTNLRKTTMARPPLDEQKELVRRMSTCAQQMVKEGLTLGKLNKLKQGLMNDLLTGKVRVKVEEPS